MIIKREGENGLLSQADLVFQLSDFLVAHHYLLLDEGLVALELDQLPLHMVVVLPLQYYLGLEVIEVLDYLGVY